MRLNHCHTILHVFILVGLLSTLDAESEDSDCSPGIEVRRNTVHEALLGGDLMINCTLIFCNNSPSTVSWYKVEKPPVPVNFNRTPHIKTEWKLSNQVEGISFLIFQNIQRNDSGQYRCQCGSDVGHAINVSVDESDLTVELTTVTRTTPETGNTTTQDALWPYVYRVPGVVLFVIIVTTIYVASKRGCKGVRGARKSKNPPDLSLEPLPGGSSANQHDLSTIHIYENDPNATPTC